MSLIRETNRNALLMASMVGVMVAVFLAGCGTDEKEYICNLGESKACPCIGGGQGVQECAEDKQGWMECMCASADGQRDGSGGAMTGRAVGDDSVSGGNGDAMSGGAMSAGAASGGDVSDGSAGSGGESGGAAGGGSPSGGSAGPGGESGGEVSGGTPSGGVAMGSVTLWAHSFEGTFGPGSGLQPGDMETQGEQGFTDGGSWISTGGWLNKTISTVGYTTIEVRYLLTKDAGSTCGLNISVDDGRTWTNVLSDNGPGGYRVNTTLPVFAEGEERVLIRWTSMTAWCWMNDITITALVANGGEDGMSADDMNGSDDADSAQRPAVFHVFLLMGQSNMAGCDVITPQDRISDERISVLGYETCPGTQRISNAWDVASPPLHSCAGGIGPGDYFAKTMAEALPEGHTMGLVPTAVPGQWIETFLQGGIHHQDILDKIEIAAGVENARFSGIIFHQGESNSGDVTWPGKVRQLYSQVKAAMGIDYDIPFIAGEMLHGGNCEAHNTLVHEVANLGDNFHYVSAEGLVMAPGDEWLVHFDHGSQVTLGRRYGEKMRAILGW